MCPKETLGSTYSVCLLGQMRGDDAIDDPEHLDRDHRTAGKEKTQLEWKTEHPLVHWLMWHYPYLFAEGSAPKSD